MSLIVCTAPTFIYRQMSECWTCKRRTRHVRLDHVWWGCDFICLVCGEFEGDSFYSDPDTPTERLVKRDQGREIWRTAPPRRQVDRAFREYMGF